MLETVGEYAEERLGDGAAATATRDRHAGYFLRLAERTRPGYGGNYAEDDLRALDAGFGNLRAALRRLLAADRVEDAARLAGALWLYPRDRGHVEEIAGWLRRLLDHGPRLTDAARADLLLFAGDLAGLRGEERRSRDLLLEALELLPAEGSGPARARCLWLLAWSAVAGGDLDRGWSSGWGRWRRPGPPATRGSSSGR
jgi:hypothetical protein